MNHSHLSPVSPARSLITITLSSSVTSSLVFRAAGFSPRGYSSTNAIPNQEITQRRTWPIPIVAILIFACATSRTLSEEPNDKISDQISATNTSNKPVELQQPLDGIWPTPKLIKSVLRRWAYRVGDRYELDEDQQAQVEKAVVDRWTGFLTEHRKTFQPLFNEFIELRMEVEPPDKESVTAWATRAEYAFDMVREELTRATQDVREVLTLRQRIKFETDMLAFGGGLEMAKLRLERYKQGDFEPQEFWTPTAPERRKRREARSRGSENNGEPATVAGQIPSETLDESADQIMTELSRWQVYVTEFISLYDLNEGQRTTAVSCLRELSQRAADHRNRHQDDIDQLERRITENTSSDTELERINDDLVKLYGPIDDLFAELQTRLDRIPTARQRKLATTSFDNASKVAQPPAKNHAPTEPPTRETSSKESPTQGTFTKETPSKPIDPPLPLPRGD